MDKPILFGGLKNPVPSLSEIQQNYHKEKIERFNKHNEPRQRAPSNAFRNNYDGIKWAGETVYAKVRKLRPNPLRDDMEWTPFRCEY